MGAQNWLTPPPLLSSRTAVPPAPLLQTSAVRITTSTNTEALVVMPEPHSCSKKQEVSFTFCKNKRHKACSNLTIVRLVLLKGWMNVQSCIKLQYTLSHYQRFLLGTSTSKAFKIHKIWANVCLVVCHADLKSPCWQCWGVDSGHSEVPNFSQPSFTVQYTCIET